MAAAMIIAGQNFSDPRVALMLLVVIISTGDSLKPASQ